MKNDLISVVVPVYNVEPYLNRCIDSIIGQTYQNLEIILVDDGSTDGSPQICDKYRLVDDRIIVIHQKNKGLSGARNTGIKIAKGEYISFLDSDDYIDVKFIETLYTTAIHKDADIVVCDIRSFDAYTLQFFPHTRNLENGFVDTKQIFETMMKIDYPWIYTMACNKLYSREIFDSALYMEGFIHEDEIIFLDIIKQSPKIYQINDSLFYYCRGREDSIINKKYSIKRLDALVAFYDRIEYFRQDWWKNRKLVKNEQVKILRKIKIVLQKLEFDDNNDIKLFQNEVKKAGRNCVRSFKCLKMYLSILLNKKYIRICNPKR